MKWTKFTFPFVILSFSVLIAFVSCNGDDPEDKSVDSCLGCHTNYAHLQLVYSPDTVEAAGGCGGEAPHYEPFDRVFMDPTSDGYAEYKESSHFAVGCTGCHNGVDGTDDKTEAHSGDFLRHPSKEYDAKCGTCHNDIANNFTTSLHHGTGQKRKVTIRSGLAGAHEFDMLPEMQKEGYEANCAICHGTCGNCHVVRPHAGGGGLKDGHSFVKTPDMINTCVVCHTSRGGHAYLGVAVGTQPDVHLSANGFDCLNCHSGHEMHGNGEPVDQRYAYDELPSCTNCHADISNSNLYHSMHINSFNCQVCHSQDYNNCGSCHIHGEGARIPSYLGFKIAMNPIPDVKTDFNLTLVRRALSAPDSWKEYGVDELSNFDAFPTYNFTTPHNILKWTTRTNVAPGASCYANCHIANVDGTLVNKELYLFQEDLDAYEVGATSSITVDNALPASWFEE